MAHFLAPDTWIDRRYRIVELIDRGGVGHVYLAESQTPPQNLALKILDPKDASHPHEVIERFKLRAEQLRDLNHPNIVEYLDFGIDRQTGLLFMAMERLDGESVAQRLQRVQTFEVHHALNILKQIAASLDHMHRQGLTHRELQATHVILTADAHTADVVKVLAFGMARIFDTERKPLLDEARVNIFAPPCLAPELIAGDDPTPRTDIYAMTSLTYQMLIGVPPFPGDTVAEVLRGHFERPPPDLLEMMPSLDLSQAAADYLRHNLSKNPSDRARSASTFMRELERTVQIANYAYIPIKMPEGVTLGEGGPPDPNETLAVDINPDDLIESVQELLLDDLPMPETSSSPASTPAESSNEPKKKVRTPTSQVRKQAPLASGTPALRPPDERTQNLRLLGMVVGAAIAISILIVLILIIVGT